MAKYEVEFEVTGLKLDSVKFRVRGDREDVRMGTELGRQFLSVMQPPAGVADDSARKQIASSVVSNGDSNGNSGAAGSRGKGGRRAKGASNGAPSAPPIAWAHDPSKWGMPRQSWTEANKALWVLYVIMKETGQTEVGGPSIADTFNDKFKQFGPLKKSNIPRTMGRLKTNNPAYVMDNPTKAPITWYLTDEGSKASERLVQEAKTPAEAAAANG